MCSGAVPVYEKEHSSALQYSTSAAQCGLTAKLQARVRSWHCTTGLYLVLHSGMRASCRQELGYISVVLVISQVPGGSTVLHTSQSVRTRARDAKRRAYLVGSIWICGLAQQDSRFVDKAKVTSHVQGGSTHLLSGLVATCCYEGATAYHVPIINAHALVCEPEQRTGVHKQGGHRHKAVAQRQLPRRLVQLVQVQVAAMKR